MPAPPWRWPTCCVGFPPKADDGLPGPTGRVVFFGLAELPSREQLLAQVLATINAPATQTVGVIASGIRQVLNVLQAYVDKLEEGNKPAEAAA